MNILAVIPARGGSKGVPRKNIRLLGGKPLIAWTIEVANLIPYPFMDCLPVVSTEDKEIENIAREYKATPILRPAKLAGDDVPMLPVIQNAINQMENWFEEVKWDWVMCLQPTSPFRSPWDINMAIQIAEMCDCDSVISVVKVGDHHPARMYYNESGRLVPMFPQAQYKRRQDLWPLYLRNGAIYLTKRDVIMGGSMWGEKIIPYEMPEERSINIDTELDFKLAEAML